MKPTVSQWILGFVVLSTVTHAAVYDRDGKVLSRSGPSDERLRWKVLDYADTSAAKFGGVGVVEAEMEYQFSPHETPTGDLGYGSGVLLDMRKDKSVRADAVPAYVLTVGHNVLPIVGHPSFLSHDIVSTPGPGPNRSLTVTFNVMKNAPFRKRLRYDVKQIHFAAMKSVDVALLELPVSLQTLLDQGITGFEVSERAPDYQEKVFVLGVPEALRAMVYDEGYSLEVESLTSKPNYSIFDWRSHVRVNASMVEGVSGGPILTSRDSKIVGLAAFASGDINYFQPVWQLREAFSETGRVNLDAFRRAVRPCVRGLTPSGN